MALAVIKTGGKQYTVQEGDIVKIEKLAGKVPQSIEFPDILDGKKVQTKVIEHGKSKKIRVAKFRQKTGYHKVYGHRQLFTKIKVESIK